MGIFIDLFFQHVNECPLTALGEDPAWARRFLLMSRPRPLWVLFKAMIKDSRRS